MPYMVLEKVIAEAVVLENAVGDLFVLAAYTAQDRASYDLGQLVTPGVLAWALRSASRSASASVQVQPC